MYLHFSGEQSNHELSVHNLLHVSMSTYVLIYE